MKAQPDSPTPPKAKPTALRTAALTGLVVAGLVVAWMAFREFYMSPSAVNKRKWSSDTLSTLFDGTESIFAFITVLMACVQILLTARTVYRSMRNAPPPATEQATGRSRAQNAVGVVLLLTASFVMTLLLTLWTSDASVPSLPVIGVWLTIILIWIGVFAIPAMIARGIGRYLRGANTPAAGEVTTRSLTSDLLGRALLFATACGVTILVTLEFFSTSRHNDAHWPISWLLCAFVALPAVITSLARWLGARSPRWGMVGLLLLAPVFVYLARDDAQTRHAMSYADISPAGPGMAESNAVLLQWSSKVIQNMEIPHMPVAFNKAPKLFTPDWWAWVRSHREEIDHAGWANTKVRDWWAAWSTYPEVGDLSDGVDSPQVNWQPIRVYRQIIFAEATALAQDGRGDEAIEHLLPLIIGGAKLQPYSRTLKRSMTGILIRLSAIDAAESVLKEATVSAAMRSRLANALATGQGGEKMARRLVAVEFAYYHDQLSDPLKTQEITGGRVWSALIGPVMLNPNRTLNLIGDLMLELQELAARKDYEGMAKACERYHAKVHARYSIKNVVGCVETLGKPKAFISIVTKYWAAEEKGAALIARLRGEAGATPPTAATEDKK